MLESADIFYRQYSEPKCIYCFIEKEEILCKCKDCDFYFCNGINDNTEKSHIIFHQFVVVSYNLVIEKINLRRV